MVVRPTTRSSSRRCVAAFPPRRTPPSYSNRFVGKPSLKTSRSSLGGVVEGQVVGGPNPPSGHALERRVLSEVTFGQAPPERGPPPGQGHGCRRREVRGPDTPHSRPDHREGAVPKLRAARRLIHRQQDGLRATPPVGVFVVLLEEAPGWGVRGSICGDSADRTEGEEEGRSPRVAFRGSRRASGAGESSPTAPPHARHRTRRETSSVPEGWCVRGRRTRAV